MVEMTFIGIQSFYKDTNIKHTLNGFVQAIGYLKIARVTTLKS